MSDFKEIPMTKVLKDHNKTISHWRHKFVAHYTGQIYSCGGGEITIELPDGSRKTFKTSNLAKRLDNLIYQLMSPRPVKTNDKWIAAYQEKFSPLTIEQIQYLKIWVKHLV